MTDWTPEEDEAFNDVEKHSNLGKQILRDMGQPYVYAPKREWVGLTDEEKKSFWTADQMTQAEWDALFNAIEAKLKEKNERTI
jgi:hypothetical protein